MRSVGPSSRRHRFGIDNHAGSGVEQGTLVYGHLSDTQLKQLVPFVKDQSILDLGAGELGHAELLLELGARDILAIDRFKMPKPSSSRITTKVTQFHDWTESRPVVFASWIVNWTCNLEHLLLPAQRIVVLSKNTDGSSCGYREMWELLQQKELLLYVPEHANTLTVYGNELVDRPPTGEEFAALHPEKMWSFEEAEERARNSKVASCC